MLAAQSRPASSATRGLSRRALLAAPALAMPGFGRRALAAAPVRIGMIATLSGPGGYLGEDIRDAFRLAVDMQDGALGGIPVELIVEDDGLKPDQGRQIASRLGEAQGVRLFTGIVFSNVLQAVVPELLDDGAIYVGPNAATSDLAGAACHPNYYVVSWTTQSVHEAVGANAERLGFRRVFAVAPNYQAGKDAMAGFRRRFTGTIVEEVFTGLGQTDFAAEMARIRAAAPDAVFEFQPGGVGIAFLRQYQQAGLAGQVPLVVGAPSLDARMLPAVAAAALGVNVTAQWNADFDNLASRRFVAAFTARHDRVPTIYASQGYDTANAIGAALKGCGGNVADTDAFRRAMLPAAFESVRGKFRFGPNQHPVQDWWGLQVEQDGAAVTLRTRDRILSDQTDPAVAQCRL